MKKLKQAKAEADEFTRWSGIVAHVVKFNYGFDWVSSHFFDIYKKRKIYYTTKPDEV